MKKTLFAMAATAALSAVPARAITLADVCGRLMYSDQTQRCLDAASGRYTDPYALEVCNRLMYADSTIQCVGAVAGRSYQTAEVDLCDRAMYASETIRCLGSAGRLYEGERRERRECGEGREGMRALVLDCKARFSSDADRWSCVVDAVGL